MLRSLRAQIIGAYVLIIVLPFSLLGWFMLKSLDQFYLDRLQDDMNTEAALLAQAFALEVQSKQAVETQEVLDKLPQLLGSQARVLVFDTSARLIGVSDSAFAASLGQPLSEPGLAEAIAGRTMRGVQVSPVTDISIAYVAQPIIYEGQIVGAIHLSYSLAQIADAESDLRAVVIGVVTITVLFASIYGLWITRSIRGPLARLEAAAHKIASGDLTQRVPDETTAELAPLAQNFNRMAEALQRAAETRKLTLAHIAHDVRTPLGSIRAAVEALADGAMDQPELRGRLLAGLLDQLQYMRRLTDDLLRLAAYENRGLVLQCKLINLQPLIARAVGSVKAQASARSIRMTYGTTTSLPLVWADPDRLLEVLFNLLDNAIRHTPAGGHIRIVAETDTRGVCVRVCDSGQGIPEDILPHIFERPWHAHQPGVGLGLSIVRQIVKAHNGAVWAANGFEGGAEFCFALPIAAEKVISPAQ